MGIIMRKGVPYGGGSGDSIEVVTREKYNELETASKVDPNVYYFISEEDAPEWVFDETGKITGYKTKTGGADTVFPFKSEPTVIVEEASLTYRGSGTYNISTTNYGKSATWSFNTPMKNGKYPVVIGFKKTSVNQQSGSDQNITDTVELSYTRDSSTFSITYTTTFIYGNKGPTGTLVFVYVN